MTERMIFVFDKEEYEIWRCFSISSCQVAFNARHDIRFRCKSDSDKYIMSIEEASKEKSKYIINSFKCH